MNTIVNSALFTDFYELTMAQGYWKRGINEHRVVFDYFFRRHPFSGGYSVFAGLGTLLEALENFHFSQDDLAYLETLDMFEKGFLDYLGNFRFSGDLLSAREGELIFPQEPILRVEGDLVQAQIVEGLVLNTLNFPKPHSDEIGPHLAGFAKGKDNGVWPSPGPRFRWGACRRLGLPSSAEPMAHRTRSLESSTAFPYSERWPIPG